MSDKGKSACLLALFAATTALAQDLPAPADEQTVPVAEPVETPPPLTDEELLRSEFLRYKELVEDGILDEADSVAKRVVELAIRTGGPTSSETAHALTNLALVQHRTGQYGAAQQNYGAAIEIIEENEDRLNQALVNPLRGLGAAQLSGGRPDLAAQTFGRAVHITHVNEGPHNMQQVEMLESLAETQLRMGLIEDAKNVHETIYALNLRFFQSNPLDMVPSLMRRANWQHRTGYIYDEQATYRRIIRIIETSTSKSDVRLIPPLTKLGRSYFYQDLSGTDPYAQISPTAGELYFKRALRIARNSPDSDWDVLSNTLIAIGDYNLFQSNQLRAKSHYLEAWNLLSEGDEPGRIEKQRNLLGQVRLLRSSDLPRYAGSATSADRQDPDVSLREGTIEYTYDVDARGRVANFKIVEADPVEFYDIRRLLIREMRSRLYRPRYDAGGPVDTTGLRTTHRFLYKVSELNAIRSRDKETDPAEPGDEASEAD